MAPTRLEKPAAVGSIAWIHGEKQLADSYVAQEKEEFAFSARNEMEWLNEHMAEVMARRDLYDNTRTVATITLISLVTWLRSSKHRGSFVERHP